MRILVLGTGLQGRATLHDLARIPTVSHVIAADADLAGLTRYLFFRELRERGISVQHEEGDW